MAVDHPETYNEYVTKLSEMTGVQVQSFAELVTALDKRDEFFHAIGGRIPD
jgi:glucuronate isomerase